MNVVSFNRYFLIDYENVNVMGLKGLDVLDCTDSVIIFYSEHAQSLTFEYHNKINSAQANIQFIEVEATGDNALDFQLSSYLGFIISENLNCFPDKSVSYYIISKDKGYKPLISFWSKLAEIKQYTDLSLKLSTEIYIRQSEDTLAKKAVADSGIIIPNNCPIKGNDINKVLNIVDGNINLTQEILNLLAHGDLKNNQTNLNNLLVKYYSPDNKKAGMNYHLIMDLLT